MAGRVASKALRALRPAGSRAMSGGHSVEQEIGSLLFCFVLLYTRFKRGIYSRDEQVAKNNLRRRAVCGAPGRLQRCQPKASRPRRAYRAFLRFSFIDCADFFPITEVQLCVFRTLSAFFVASFSDSAFADLHMRTKAWPWGGDFGLFELPPKEAKHGKEEAHH